MNTGRVPERSRHLVDGSMRRDLAAELRKAVGLSQVAGYLAQRPIGC